MNEPTIEVFHGRTIANRLLTYLAATRPAFLTASILPVLVAGALVHALKGDVSAPLLMLAVLGIALIHGGANVLNDYFDGLSGNDERNTARVFPFSGGSRFIQNSVLSLRETRNLGVLLMASGAAVGIAMVWLTGPLLLALGLLGGVVAVTYSAPPCLACRGLGDAAVALTFGLLPVAGTSLVLMHAIPVEAWWAGAVVGCLVAAILWANSIPDIAADRRAGKLTLPVRFGARVAARLLPVWFAAGFALLLASPLPRWSWLMLLAAVPAAMASRAILAGRLLPALPLTILTHAAACALLAIGLLLARAG